MTTTETAIDPAPFRALFEGAGDLIEGKPARLAATACAGCHRQYFPAHAVCPTCGGSCTERLLGPAATLYRATAVLHAPPGATVEVPYHVGLALFDKGLCVLGLLLGVGDQAPPAGASLEVVAHRLVDDVITYAFRLT
jgi:uncharacterized OB-fold protein